MPSPLAESNVGFDEGLLKQVVSIEKHAVNPSLDAKLGIHASYCFSMDTTCFKAMPYGNITALLTHNEQVSIIENHANYR